METAGSMSNAVKPYRGQSRAGVFFFLTVPVIISVLLQRCGVMNIARSWNRGVVKVV